MKDQEKTKQQLIAENEELRQRVTTLEGLRIEGKQAEGRVQESQRRLLTLMSNLPGMAYRCRNDPHWTMEFISDGCVLLTGYTPMAFTDNHEVAYGDIIHPDDRERVWKEVQQAIAKRKHFQLEYRIHTVSGEEKWVWEQGIAINSDSGQVEALEGLMTDVTDRKRAEDAVRQSEERFRLLVEQAVDGIFVSDAQGRYLDVNMAGCEMLGYSREEILARTIADVVAAEEVPHIAPHVARFVGGAVTRSEWRFRRKDGSYFSGEVVGRQLPDGRLQAILRDITERKHAQAALQKAHDELELRVEERTAELRKANKELDIFRRFAEASRQGFGMANMDGFVTYLNPAACRIVGAAKPEDVIGKHLTAFYPEGYMLRRESEIFPTLLQEGHWEGELVLSSAGRTMYVLQNSFLIKDENGNPTHIASVTTDITERKRVEEALRQSEERLRLAQQVARVGTFEWNVQTGLSSWTPGLEALYGLSPGQFPGTHRAWEKLVHCDDRANVVRLGEEVLETGEPLEGEWRVVWPDGSVHWLAARCQAFKDEAGKPLRMVGVNIDITERKRAEGALRQSERRFRNYFEQGLIGMAVASVDKRWLEVNDRLCEILGHSREELIQSNWAELTHPDDLEPNLQLFNRLLAGEIGHFTLDKRFVKKDQSIVNTTIHIRAVHKDDGSIDHIVALTEDITARKQAEEALRASEQRFRSYFEQGLIGMAVSLPDRRWIQVNDRYCDMLGYSREELLGMKWTDLTHPDDLERNLTPLNRALAGEIEHHILEKRFIRKDGSIMYAAVFARCFRRQDGSVDHFLSLVEDITERKKAEEALERERQSLWRMLQASDHERQIISYDIHDGLAQYLASATMQFQAHDALRENSPNEAKKAYETALELVRQSHAEARRLISEVRPPIIDENGIEMAISHLVFEQRRHGGPKIELHSSVQFGRLPAILENALYRIVQEALGNACIHSQSKKVTVTMTQEGQDVRLEVRDWGIGFDPEAVTKGHFGVEGIRQRVRLLGGRLTIESTPGSGTLVQVTVPIVENQIKE